MFPLPILERPSTASRDDRTGPSLGQLYLLPGELVITSKPQRIITLLGSCVAIIMFHPHFRAAAICHGMLPKPPPHITVPYGHSKQDRIKRFKYLSEAISEMVMHFSRLGGPPSGTKVKIFGGADILTKRPPPVEPCMALAAAQSVGTANLRIANGMLDATQFCVTACDVGGTRGRKIIFDTFTGHVLHRYLG